MTRYLFSIDDGLSASEDVEIELDGLSAARETARRFLGHCLAFGPTDFWECGEWRLTVADESHLTLFMIDVVATEAPAAKIIATPNPVTT